MSAAETLFREGRLHEALAELQQQVRSNPAAVPPRIFLVQLLMTLGAWDRALTQLKVLEEMDAGTLPMVRTYETAIRCERLRLSVIGGERSPLVFGDPQPWLALLVQSLSLLNAGKVEQAAQLRAEALKQAPACGGMLNGTAFEWIADADSRFGPVLEVLLNGAYYWVPFNRIQRIEIAPPADVRDLVWLPAKFIWANQGEADGLIPVRYPLVPGQEDAALLMARRTDWQQRDDSTFIGHGQRMLATDAAELGLLEVRELTLDVTEPALA